MPSKTNLIVGVVEPFGMTSPYTVVELLNQGLSVVGISRNQLVVGNYDRDNGVSIDFGNVGTSEITGAFQGSEAR